MKLILSTDGLLQKYAWPQPDGKFVIHNVPAGSHLLDIAAVGLTYPQVRFSRHATVLSFVLAEVQCDLRMRVTNAAATRRQRTGRWPRPGHFGRQRLTGARNALFAAYQLLPP